jgi:putative hydrolase of HD superfamily
MLKRIPRTGWLLRGVGPSEVESVAEHTWGMSLVALMLAELIDQPVDRGRLATMCLVHDLAESVIGDWPWPALRYLSRDSKQEAEAGAMQDLLYGLPFADGWLKLWRDFEAGDSVEARLARDADRLDMLLQAAAYEAAGRRGLEEFWQVIDEDCWHFPVTQELACQLFRKRRRVGEV